MKTKIERIIKLLNFIGFEEKNYSGVFIKVFIYKENEIYINNSNNMNMFFIKMILKYIKCNFYEETIDICYNFINEHFHSEIRKNKINNLITKKLNNK